MNLAELLYQKLTEMGRKIERPSEGIVGIPADKLRFYTTPPLDIVGFPERLGIGDPREAPFIDQLAFFINRDIAGTIGFIKPKAWPPGQGIESEVFSHEGVQVQRISGFDIRSYRMISRLGVNCYSAEDATESSLDTKTSVRLDT